MSTAQRDAFLRETRIATLVTLGADGAPSAVPVWYEWDGQWARMFTDRDSSKIARIRADPRVCLSVGEPVGATEAWVTIEGEARIEEEGGLALAERLAPRYYSPQRATRALDDWRRIAERWVVIAIEPSRIRSLAPD